MYTQPDTDSLNGLAPKEMRIPAPSSNAKNQLPGQQSIPEYYTRGSTPDRTVQKVQKEAPEPLPRYHKEEFNVVTMFLIPLLIITIVFTTIWKALVSYIKRRDL